MICEYCNNLASNECPVCQKPFCDNCGNVMCINCTEPSEPKENTFYQGSLIMLLVASIFFLWFIVDNKNFIEQTTEIEQKIIVDESITNKTIVENNERKPVIIRQAIQPTPKKDSKSIIEESTKSADQETEIKPTIAKEVKKEYEIYTVKEGDSLYAIAMKFLTLGDDIEEYLDKVINYNDINNPNDIQIGQSIRMPIE
ncbi:MAG: LysM peptidoglycan-binding domain-containing protein [Dehalococcoidia bacterium]|nr:LysM peptidoglycan-binding domain-containing protein [Dehalococcoidia bacterium]